MNKFTNKINELVHKYRYEVPIYIVIAIVNYYCLYPMVSARIAPLLAKIGAFHA